MPLAHVESLPIKINWNGHTPPFIQIANQIYCIIKAVQLKPGDILPQIRRLAAQLDANPNTVARAYAELEKKGVIRKRQGSGCFVTGAGKLESNPEERLRPLEGRIDELVLDAAGLGVSPAQLAEKVRACGAVGKVPASKRPARVMVPNTNKPVETGEIVAPKQANLWQSADFLID